jgi:predicted RNase H-like HicB family nuclease
MKDLEYFMSLTYPIVVEELPDRGYVAYIPVLGEHMFTACGDTIDEAISALEEVKRDRFRLLLDNGIPIPEPYIGEESEYA